MTATRLERNAEATVQGLECSLLPGPRTIRRDDGLCPQPLPHHASPCPLPTFHSLPPSAPIYPFDIIPTLSSLVPTPSFQNPALLPQLPLSFCHSFILSAVQLPCARCQSDVMRIPLSKKCRSSGAHSLRWKTELNHANSAVRGRGKAAVGRHRKEVIRRGRSSGESLGEILWRRYHLSFF